MVTTLEPALGAAGLTDSLAELPILILNVHSHCNCRCVMCDIWKRKTHTSISAMDLERHRDSLRSLKVRQVVLTGGEPLLNGDLVALCEFFRELGIRVTLLTTGLLLKKRAEEVAANVDEVIVSLDGPEAVHDAIRRVPGGFRLIAEGIAAVRARHPAIRISARCTVQRANHPFLRKTVDAGKRIGLDALSFLAVDVSSSAFNRDLVWPVERQSEVALTRQEANELDCEVERLIAEQAEQPGERFVVETPEKLRRIARTFRVHLGEVSPASPVCNAPWVSAVIEIDGSVRPCFFHPAMGTIKESDLRSLVTGDRAREFRKTLDVATNAVCQRCVCSLNYAGGE